MIKEEVQNETDNLIIEMITKRDDRITYLEKENRDLKQLLLDLSQENKNLKKINKGLKSKWYRREK